MNTGLKWDLNDDIVKDMATLGDKGYPYDCCRRLLQMFGDTVLKVLYDNFEAEILVVKQAFGAMFDAALTASDLKTGGGVQKGVREARAASPVGSL